LRKAAIHWLLAWWCGWSSWALASGSGLSDPAPAASAPLFLWELRSPSSTSYLLGSLHAAQDEVYPLPEAMEAAFGTCDTLVVEADIGGRPESEMLTMVLAQAVNTGGSSWIEQLDEDSTRRLSRILSRHGLTVDALRRFRAWYVAQTISLLEMKRLGMRPENGIDRHFLSRARGAKLILELEGLKQQLALFSGLSDREQELLLQYTLRDVENLEVMLDDITAAWREGDEAKLDQLLNGYVRESQGLEGVFAKLFRDRNRLMAGKIRDYLRTDRDYFIVVGAGHLVGSDGLLRLLSDSGIRIRQLTQELDPAKASP
jgi:uncharacterized protein YbaP (TraB family)